MLAENFHHDENQIVEVERVVFDELFLVDFVNFGDTDVVVAGIFLVEDVFAELGGVLKIIFCLGNSVGGACETVFVESEFFNALVENGLAVGGVVDCEAALEDAGDVDFAAKKSCAERMESAYPGAAGWRANHFFSAGFHFVGCLVGEGYRQNVPRLDAMRQQICNAAGQNFGFAGAGACQYQQGTIEIFYGFNLRRI